MPCNNLVTREITIESGIRVMIQLGMFILQPDGETDFMSTLFSCSLSSVVFSLPMMRQELDYRFPG
jgi:hypothetical protein